MEADRPDAEGRPPLKERLIMRRLLRLLIWPAALAALVGLFALAHALNERKRREKADEAAAAAQTPKRANRGVVEAVEFHEKRVERLRKLASPEIVSRRELDDALIALADARAQQEIARGAGDLWQKALRTLERAGDTPAAWAEDISTPAAGE